MAPSRACSSFKDIKRKGIDVFSGGGGEGRPQWRKLFCIGDTSNNSVPSPLKTSTGRKYIYIYIYKYI